MRRILLLSITVLIFVSLLTVTFLGHAVAIFRILGFDRPKEYLILLQNNMEIRPTGGFIGSYARIRVEKGSVSLEKIEDIYTPDGQLDGHVDPPWPIQAAFGQGWYKLRDSNWDPDFPTSAKTIQWFFEHGKEPKVDGLIGVNLTLLKDLLKLTGPIFLVDEPERITYENFYKKTQAAVEEDFFPGSNQKRNFLNTLGKAVFQEMKSLSFKEKFKLLTIFWELLKEKQVIIYTNDQYVQDWLVKRNFAGSLGEIKNTNKDYLAIFESNLGANKANCCVAREITLKTENLAGRVKHDLIINFENKNPSSIKQPPQSWGGAYVNFLRIGIPITAKVTKIMVGDLEYPIPSSDSNLVDSKESVNSLINLMKISDDSELVKFITGDDAAHQRVDLEKRADKGLQFIGFFVAVDALSNKSISIIYEDLSVSAICLQKQSGVESIPVVLNDHKFDLVTDLCLGQSFFTSPR